MKNRQTQDFRAWYTRHPWS